MTTFSCTNITRRYKNFCLDNVSFSMETGYFYVLAGVNGSGKTTLLNCITGVDSSFLHGILWNAQIGDVSLKASPEAYRRKLGYISERCPFFYGGIRRTERTLLMVNSIRTGPCGIIPLISAVWMSIRQRGSISFPKGSL